MRRPASSKEAVKWQKKALKHPAEPGAATLGQAKQRLKLYESRGPYHEPKKSP
jgi:hypothetical protein